MSQLRTRIRALTLWPPWGSLLACKFKAHETRSWPLPVDLIGEPVAIHQSAAVRADVRELCNTDPRFVGAIKAITKAAPDSGSLVSPVDLLPLGAVIAVCRFDLCRRTDDFVTKEGLDRHFGDWSPGRYSFRAADVWPLDVPVPTRGRQGIWYWDVPAQLAAELTARYPFREPGAAVRQNFKVRMEAHGTPEPPDPDRPPDGQPGAG